MEFFYVGVYYHIKKEIDEAHKYYLMAIEHNFVYAMRDLGDLYYRLDDNITIRYYIMAAEHGYNCQRMIDIMLKKLFNGTEHISTELLELICTTSIFDRDDTPNYLKLLRSTYRIKIDLFEIHFKYQPGAEGIVNRKRKFSQENE